MGSNLEKFVIDLGFSSKDLKQLKDLLKLQADSEKMAKNSTSQEIRQQEKLNSLDRKRLQVKNLIAKAEKEGVDVSKYKRSLAAAQKISTLEKRRIELDEALFEAKAANAKKTLNTEKAITQEVKKQSAIVKDTGQARDTKRRFKAQLGVLSGEHRDLERKQLREAYVSDDYNTRIGASMPSRALFEKDQARRKQEDAIKVKERVTAINRKSLADSYARNIALRAKVGGLSSSMIESLKGEAKAAFGTKALVEGLNVKLKELIYQQRKATLATRKQSLAMQGLNDSTRHLIRTYASLYTALGATTYIKDTAQKFQSMESAMLAATGTSQKASSELEFLDGMTSKLGLSLLDTSDAYTKFLFASKGKLGQSEVRELFEGLSELGTTLGVSKDRMKLSMNAITQMMNKGKISSEELRLQLAESLPGAIPIFARAIGKSEAELFKMMESGQLLSADVLPKVAKEMKKVASVGLDEKRKGSLVAEGQFINQLEKSTKTVFKGDMEKAYSELLRSITTYLGENEDTLRSLGQIFSATFNIIEGALRVVTPIVGTFIERLSDGVTGINKMFGEGSAEMVGKWGTMVAIALSPLTRILTIITFALDEIDAFFTPQKIGLLEKIAGWDLDFRDDILTSVPIMTIAKGAWGAVTGEGQDLYQATRISDYNNAPTITNTNEFHIQSNDPEEIAKFVEERVFSNNASALLPTG